MKKEKMKKRKYRKLYKLTPLNEEIKRIEAKIYKEINITNVVDNKELALKIYLGGLLKARELIRGSLPSKN